MNRETVVGACLGMSHRTSSGSYKESRFFFFHYLFISLVAQTIKNLPAKQETWLPSLGWEDPPGEGNGYSLQYSCLENSMDREAWRATVHGVEKSQTPLSD